MEDRNEEAIFDAAMELVDPAERARFVTQACGGDRKLLADVEALLRSHDSRSLLDVPVVDAGAVEDPSSPMEGPGTTIGRYKLLEKIGEGGMAVVYMAEQMEPIRRKVALKIIKLGMDTRQVIARFEAERQALALMDHPNIAKVLDAGATETGRPYFVMELVQGVSITAYCDKNNLSTKDRLVLFVQVCNAVQHAHQKGIIHRDIKPSNVMITRHDGKPVPKVIDFGIAKATNQRLTEKTLFTRYAHIIGTPAYMSPEQAELSDLDIDTRTDIYSLGVLLYELLTGTTPFSEEELRKAGYIEMQRVIREQEPTKPSTKLSTLGDTLTDIAKHRNSTPDLLRKSIRGDLDWIVMKSLEKDRVRRYETADGLASDIQRHLGHEPVVARGPSTTYRLQKFLRRHRSQTVAALAMVIFAGFAVVILSMWNRDRLQLTEAEGFRHRGILSQAREQYAKADRDAALETIKPILDSRYVGPEAQLLYAAILVDNRRSDEAMSVLNNLLNGHPEIAGAAHSLLARILYESASPNAEKLKEIDEHRQKAEALLPETAEAYFLRAMTAMTVKEQLAALNKALELDLQHYESRRLRAFIYYASRKYEKMREDSLVLTVLRPRDALAYSLRAIALRELGKYKEAIAGYDNAIRLTAKGSPQHVDLSAQRCETLLWMGEYERVIADAQECLKLSSDTPVFQYYIFSALTALGNYEKACGVFREIVGRTHTSRNEFQDWCAKYVFDTLEAGRSWHPPSTRSAPAGDLGAAFLPMVEAEETYRSLSAKAKRVVADGFSARWSPDGKKLAFSAGVHGYSGVALYDPATKETELLIVPGKDPRWSPDGKYIAFVRDCRLLRLEEMARTENNRQQRPLEDEEVWLMKSDGTEPRLLARGSWPSWGSDCEHLYYQSHVDYVLFSISIVDQNARPKEIIKCSDSPASVSPDNKRLSYFEGGKLKIKDLASKKLVAECPVPSMEWGMTAWSATRNEVCICGSNESREKTGLWIYDLDKGELWSVLHGQIGSACWSSTGTNLTFSIGLPYFEIWAANLDPNVSTVETLEPAQTPKEHFQEMLTLYTRRIEADPNDAYAYSDRAHYYDYLNDQAKAIADMKRWSAILGGSDLQAAKSKSIASIINGPFNYQFVFSAERPVNAIPMMSIAFGQKPSGSFVQPGCESSTKAAKKGRCSMKSFKIPVLSTGGIVTSLLGLCLLSGLDAPARADFTFGQPVNLRTIIPSLDPAHENIDCFSSDGLEMYIQSDRPGGQGYWDVWVLKRTSKDDNWGPPENLGPAVNSSKEDTFSSISVDGLTLYFLSDRPGGYGDYDCWTTRRATKNAPWGQAVNLGPKINSASFDGHPHISPDDLELYFASGRPGGYGKVDIYVTRRASQNQTWGEPVNIGPKVNSPYNDVPSSFSPDGLLLFFDDRYGPRPGGYGDVDIWMTRRASLSDPWQAPVNLGPKINSSANDDVPVISPDGRMLYFYTYTIANKASNETWEGWQASIEPICDFNGDGKVDGKEVLALAQHWGQSKSLFDIGLSPWGDGIVDVNDLSVLAGCVGQDANDPTLIAHWALDETAGMTAADSAGHNNVTVLGNATWQPAAGKIGGALAFDGEDDAAFSESVVLDPAAGPFSVIAWIKGGATGRVIVSQTSGADWLYLNKDGMLATDLMSPDRKVGKTLVSSASLLDDQWHRVVFTWDGTNRVLGVDGVEVARDTQPNLTASSGKLNIGAGKNLTPNTYWSGLIDEVRIYNRAVQP